MSQGTSKTSPTDTIFFKVLLLGDPLVGKTSLRRCYMGELLSSTYIMTMGADFSLKSQIIDSVEVKMQVWDLAGQPKFREIRSMYFTGAQAAILVYDITKPSTLMNLYQWHEDLLESCSCDVQLAVVGNKMDLEPKVTKEAGERFASEIGQDTLHIWTSARSGENVEFMFETIGKRVYKDLWSE
ncbi:MAG: Rab family GTPase [Promethearchaeota archaeon]